MYTKKISKYVESNLNMTSWYFENDNKFIVQKVI